MKNILIKSIAIFALTSWVGAINAGIIDLRNLPGNFDQATWGNTGSEHYAQSITADGTRWSEIGFAINDAEGGTFDVLLTGSRAAGLFGTGFAPDANAILFQQTFSHAGGGLQIFDLLINIPTIAGNVYFLDLVGFGKTISGATVRATQFNGPVDQYTGGEFIYSNDNSGLTNALTWSSRFNQNEDLAFRAVFDNAQVPTPGTLALFSFGLAGFGWLRRSKV